MHERWLLIPNYEDHYKVSSFGRIISIRHNKERLLVPRNAGAGYLKVTLYKNGIGKCFYVHRIVALCFIGKQDLEINHINANKHDNNFNNLEYISHRDNIKHATRLKLMKPRWGSPQQGFVITIDDARDIKRALINGARPIELAKQYSVTKGLIYSIRKGRCWKDA